MQESQLNKEHAYILFYVRSDVEQKDISDLFPPSVKIFPGRPINTRFGPGYCLGALQGAAVKTEVVRIAGEDVAVKMNDFVADQADYFMEQCEKQRMNSMFKKANDEDENAPSIFTRIMSYLFTSSDKTKIASEDDLELIKLQSEDNKVARKLS